MRRPLIALAAAVVIGAAAAGAVAITNSTSKQTSTTTEDHSVTNTNPPNDAPLDPDEPFIDGNPPRTAKDYVRDSKPDPQTVDDGLTESPGGGVSGEGWTAHGPG